MIDDNKEIFFHSPFVLWHQAILNGDSKRGSAPLAGVWAVGATPCDRPYQQYRLGWGPSGINRGLKNLFSVEDLINDVIDAETSSA